MEYTHEEMDKALSDIVCKARAEILDTFKSLMNDDERLEVANIADDCNLDYWSILAYNDRCDYYFYSPIRAMRLGSDNDIIIETDDDYEVNMSDLTPTCLYNVLRCIEEISNTDY